MRVPNNAYYFETVAILLRRQFVETPEFSDVKRRIEQMYTTAQLKAWQQRRAPGEEWWHLFTMEQRINRLAVLEFIGRPLPNDVKLELLDAAAVLDTTIL